MNITGTMLFLFFLPPWFSAGPQKPQTWTASKTQYENFEPKVLILHQKIGILVR
jgi:hypothetical protein